MRLTIVLSLLLIGNFGCKTNSAISTTSNDSSIEEKEQILFLNFKIEKDSTESIKIYLLGNFWARGSFKEVPEQLTLEADVLEFQFLDKQQKLLSKRLLPNPLKTSFESFSPDGNIERKEINLKQAEFTLRANVSSAAAYVKVIDVNGTIDLIALL
jgi:hypothetical protein